MFSLARLLAECRLAPRSLRMHTDRLTAFTAPMRMVMRVHSAPAHSRTAIHMTSPPGRTDARCAVFEITHLSERSIAFLANQTDFTRSQFYLGHRAIQGHKHCHGPGTPHDLSAFADFHLDIANSRASRNIFEKQTIPVHNRSIFSGKHLMSLSHSIRGENITLLSIRIVHERDQSRSVRIFFDAGDTTRNVQFVLTEINHAITALVTAALMAHRNLPSGTAGFFWKRCQKRFLRRPVSYALRLDD